ncbi:MAG: HEAT repeat domain-containing protein [Microthrixaceae bacterium]
MYPPDDRAANDPGGSRPPRPQAGGGRGRSPRRRGDRQVGSGRPRSGGSGIGTRRPHPLRRTVVRRPGRRHLGPRCRRAAPGGAAGPACRGLPVAEAEHQLLGLLEDPDATVAEMAAFALGELPRPADQRLVALHAVATGHHDALCRESAVAALGALGDPRSLPTVIEACSDRATVRRRAVLALAAFEGPEVTSTLRRLCEDRDLQVSQAATDLLQIETGEAT